MDQRTIIVGDVHGCIDELQQLIESLDYQPVSDRLIFLGDLVNKGPASREVFDYFTTLDAEAILGNHEWHLLEQARAPKKTWPGYGTLSEAFAETFETFIKTIEAWPLFIRGEGFSVVHAGKVPGEALEDSSASDLTSIRTWGRKEKPWFDYYDDPGLIVFGHWAALGGLDRPQVIGLDTGCVYGGALSALLLPERKIVRVKARKIYCPID
ncbi:MAG: metallophosphoesterase [Verrucomicrobiota bacterium]